MHEYLFTSEAVTVGHPDKTAGHGHFGGTDPDFTWERTDKADELRGAAGPDPEVELRVATPTGA